MPLRYAYFFDEKREELYNWAKKGEIDKIVEFETKISKAPIQQFYLNTTMSRLRGFIGKQHDKNLRKILDEKEEMRNRIKEELTSKYIILNLIDDKELYKEFFREYIFDDKSMFWNYSRGVHVFYNDEVITTKYLTLFNGKDSTEEEKSKFEVDKQAVNLIVFYRWMEKQINGADEWKVKENKIVLKKIWKEIKSNIQCEYEFLYYYEIEEILKENEKYNKTQQQINFILEKMQDNKKNKKLLDQWNSFNKEIYENMKKKNEKNNVDKKKIEEDKFEKYILFLKKEHAKLLKELLEKDVNFLKKFNEGVNENKKIGNKKISGDFEVNLKKIIIGAELGSIYNILNKYNGKADEEYEVFDLQKEFKKFKLDKQEDWDKIHEASRSEYLGGSASTSKTKNKKKHKKSGKYNLNKLKGVKIV
uniref:Uncharacterized protein n=1 Tax=Meloidogyne hapla TaxID=6305 RepID=A0A1I8BL50_MELHA